MDQLKEKIEVLLNQPKYLEEFKDVLNKHRSAGLSSPEIESILKGVADSPEDLMQIQANCNKDSNTGIVISAIKSVWSMLTICGDPPPGVLPPKPVKPSPTPTPTPNKPDKPNKP